MKIIQMYISEVHLLGIMNVILHYSFRANVFFNTAIPAIEIDTVVKYNELDEHTKR